MSRVQTGMRFPVEVWSSYKRLCAGQGLRPNQPLQSVMRAVVTAGSVKVLDGIMPSSEALELVDLVNVQKWLDELEGMVKAGFSAIDDFKKDEANNRFPQNQDEIRAIIDKVLAALPRVRDPGTLAKAKEGLIVANGFAGFMQFMAEPCSDDSLWLNEQYRKRLENKPDEKRGENQEIAPGNLS